MKKNLNIRFLICAFITCILFICSSSNCKAQETNYKAYSVYVYNFIKYIEWPKEYRTGEFVIAVIGDSPVTADLKVLAATKKANGQTIVIKKYASVADVEKCHVLYISSGKSSVLKAAMEKTKNSSTLVIAEREGLAKKGAGINFVTLEDDTLKFELNKKAIETHNLKISMMLVSMGLLVG